MSQSVWCGLGGQPCCWFGETQTYNVFDEIFEYLNSISNIFKKPHDFLIFTDSVTICIFLQEAGSLSFPVKNIDRRFPDQGNVYPQNYWNEIWSTLILLGILLCGFLPPGRHLLFNWKWFFLYFLWQRHFPNKISLEFFYHQSNLGHLLRLSWWH